MQAVLCALCGLPAQLLVVAAMRGQGVDELVAGRHHQLFHRLQCLFGLAFSAQGEHGLATFFIVGEGIAVGLQQLGIGGIGEVFLLVALEGGQDFFTFQAHGFFQLGARGGVGGGGITPDTHPYTEHRFARIAQHQQAGHDVGRGIAGGVGDLVALVDAHASQTGHAEDDGKKQETEFIGDGHDRMSVGMAQPLALDAWRGDAMVAMKDVQKIISRTKMLQIHIWPLFDADHLCAIASGTGSSHRQNLVA
jgi:hypothetical protein